jgi:hypothetical protein
MAATARDRRGDGETMAADRPTSARAPRGEDTGVLVDQDRVGPAELDHRNRDPIHLRVRLRTQAVDRPQLDAIGARDQSGALLSVSHGVAFVAAHVGANQAPGRVSPLRVAS